MTVEIQLTKGYVAIVDDEDSDLADFNWYAHIQKDFPYACRKPSHPPGHKQTASFLHRVVLERMLGRALVKGELCDHRDGDTMNNRHDNLRLATPQQNVANRRKCHSNTSGFKGVTWNKNCQKWQSGINHNRKHIHLGLFLTPEAAHEAYKQKASELFGEFARFE